MSESVVVRELPDIGDAEWDRVVSRYADATVFHLACWHESLERSLPGRVVRFAIDVDGEVCGHWCGFMVRRFGVQVFGAPLPGTGTDYMHPLFATSPPPVGRFLDAVRVWGKERRVGLIELGGEYFSERDLIASGFKSHPTRTYRVDLTGGQSAVWSNLKPAMRNKVRKAEKNGVTVAIDTSPQFCGRFYDMLEVVFSRQGLVPTYDLGRVEAVVESLAPAGAVVPLTAWREGAALASVVLLLDDRVAYYWGGASYESAHAFGANDLIQWHALRLAVEKGLTTYDTCGGGDYKTKFGGVLVALPAGHLSMNPVLDPVRAAVRVGFRARMRLVGWARHPVGGRR